MASNRRSSSSRNRGRQRGGQGRSRDRRSEQVIDFGQPSGSLFGLEVDPEEQAANARAAKVQVAIAVLLPAVVIGAVLGFAVQGLLGLVIGGAIAGALSGLVTSAARRRAASLLAGAPLLTSARIDTLLDSLSATMGVRRPQLRVLEDQGVNAIVLVADGAPILWVTRGLAELDDLLAVEGVLAQALASVKTGLAELRSVEAGIDLLTGGLWTKLPLPRGASAGQRAMRADMLAAAAVRYPTGLLSALEEARSRNDVAEHASSPAYEKLRSCWLDPSVGRRSLDAEVGDLDATAVRIAALSEW